MWPAAAYWALLVAVVVGGYYISLILHPNATCRLCKGRGRHFGAIYTYSQRPCRRCGGTGRNKRLGTLVREKMSSRSK